MTPVIIESLVDDRLAFEVSNATFGNWHVADEVKIIDLGAPVVDDILMCAQCVGECKIH